MGEAEQLLNFLLNVIVVVDIKYFVNFNLLVVNRHAECRTSQ